jgi:hypothetical protein
VKLPDQAKRLLRPPPLSRWRIITALAVALTTDGLQLALGPLGWVLADEVMDVVAMGLTTWLLGFHLLLLPTFVVEFIPVVDMLPTWTGCVLAVIALRRREKIVPPAGKTVELDSRRP